MNRMGKPYAGNLPVRFDEGGGVGEGRATPTLPLVLVPIAINTFRPHSFPTGIRAPVT